MVSLAPSKPGTLLAAARYFTPEACAAYITGIKWPDGPCCPKCGSISVGEIKSRARFQCREKGCRKQFSLITDTIMEATHLRLDQWILGVWQIVNCRNGVSSCEIARAIGCKQQSAWHLLHRVRHILQQHNAEQFSGACESDETFVGGLFKHMSPGRRARARTKGRAAKAVVHAIKERKSGTVRAEVIPAAQSEYVRDAIMEHVKPGSRLYTDESTSRHLSIPLTRITIQAHRLSSEPQTLAREGHWTRSSTPTVAVTRTSSRPGSRSIATEAGATGSATATRPTTRSRRSTSTTCSRSAALAISAS